MLGVTSYPLEGPADLLLKEYGEEIGVGDTFKHDPGRRLLRRARQGGRRTRTSAARGRGASGCIGCGSCMVGCRHNAKNTLVKNYLWFAEKLGVEILPERQVTDVRPDRRRRRLARATRSTSRALRGLAAASAARP